VVGRTLSRDRIVERLGVGGMGEVYCYSFPAGRLETIADIGDTPLLTWVGAPWFGLDADDNPLVMFDRSTRDLYALDWEAP
jgi:hypothetical protein